MFTQLSSGALGDAQNRVLVTQSNYVYDINNDLAIISSLFFVDSQALDTLNLSEREIQVDTADTALHFEYSIIRRERGETQATHLMSYCSLLQ